MPASIRLAEHIDIAIRRCRGASRRRSSELQGDLSRIVLLESRETEFFRVVGRCMAPGASDRDVCCHRLASWRRRHCLARLGDTMEVAMKFVQTIGNKVRGPQLRKSERAL